MHGNKRKLSKKKGSKLTVKHHSKLGEQNQIAKSHELAKQGFIKQ